MAQKLNCWEFKNCGREKNGLMVPILGECAVCSHMKFDGLNEGQAAGRACWMVPHATVRSDGTGSACTRRCYSCEFYKRVVFEQEETTRFRYTSVGR